MLLAHEIGNIIERENDNGKYKEKKKGESDFDPWRKENENCVRRVQMSLKDKKTRKCALHNTKQPRMR